MQKKDVIGKYMFIFLFLATALLSFHILKPFFIALFMATILALVFRPMYKKLNKHMHKKIAAALTVIIVFFVIVIPALFLISSLVTETYQVYQTAQGFQIPSTISLGPLNLEISNYFDSAIEGIYTFLFSQTTSIVGTLSTTIISIAIMFSALFYFLLYGAKIVVIAENILPLKQNKKKLVAKKFYEYIFATLYGTVIVALIQGFIGGITFFAFNISSPIFWGFLMFILSFLPAVGAPLVYIPAGLYQLYLGNTVAGATILLVGALIISSIDNIIKPKIVGDVANINPLVILMGALGGLAYMGFIGLFAGPLVLIIFITLLEVYEKGHHL